MSGDEDVLVGGLFAKYSLVRCLADVSKKMRLHFSCVLAEPKNLIRPARRWAYVSKAGHVCAIG